jgi:hypothetical protein
MHISHMACQALQSGSGLTNQGNRRAATGASVLTDGLGERTPQLPLPLMTSIPFSNILIDEGGKPFTGMSQTFHLLDIGATCARVGVQVNARILELHTDEVRPAFVGENAGIAVEVFVGLHDLVRFGRLAITR